MKILDYIILMSIIGSAVATAIYFLTGLLVTFCFVVLWSAMVTLSLRNALREAEKWLKGLDGAPRPRRHVR